MGGLNPALPGDSKLRPHLCLNMKWMQGEKLSWEVWGREDKGHFLGFEIHPLMRADFSLGGGKGGLGQRSERAGIP